MEALWERDHRDRCWGCDSTDVVGRLRAYKRVMNTLRTTLGMQKKSYNLHKKLEQMNDKFEKLVEQLYCERCEMRGKTPTFYEGGTAIVCICGNRASARPPDSEEGSE